MGAKMAIVIDGQLTTIPVDFPVLHIQGRKLRTVVLSQALFDAMVPTDKDPNVYYAILSDADYAAYVVANLLQPGL